MTQLDVSGMSCSHCQKAVTGALEAVAGVTRAEVDLERGLAVVEGEAEVGALIAAVEDEGYGATLRASA